MRIDIGDCNGINQSGFWRAMRLNADRIDLWTTTPRRRAFLVGKIVYGGEVYTLDCTIKDISETGVRVKVRNPFSIPNNIVFLDPKNFCAYESSVKWRKGSEMGLSFDRKIPLEDDSNPRVKILRRVSMQARAS